MGDQSAIADSAMVDGEQAKLTALQQSIQAYDQALQQLWAAQDPAFRLILEVMRSRDRLQIDLADLVEVTSDDLEKVVQLDLQLQQNFSQLAGDHTSFEQAKNSFQPPESSWWWHLQFKPKAIAKKDLSDRFDWLWNLGTVACLVASTAFVTQTAKAFSTKGFDIWGITSTIAQGAGLVFVAGGALTDRGQKIVGHILDDLRIPAKFHAEATFGASMVVLGVAYGIHQNLPAVGNFYLNQAKAYEEKGQFSKALGSYARAQDFMPDDERLLIANGFLYEKLGQFDKAIAQYEKGSQMGEPAFWNAQARAMLFRELQKNYWRPGNYDKAIKEAENLLDRATKRIQRINGGTNSQSWNIDERLAVDIQINQIIASIMAIKSKQDLQEFPQRALYPIYSLWRKQDQPEQFFETTSPSSQKSRASTLGINRIRCFQAAYSLSFSFSDSWLLSGLQALDRQEAGKKYYYECAQFINDPVLSIQPDALFLNYVSSLTNPDFKQSIDSKHFLLRELIRSLIYNITFRFDSVDKLVLNHSEQNVIPKSQSVQSREKWLAIRGQLTKLIQKQVSSPDTFGDRKTNLVWRFITNQNGQVMDYFAYDYNSRDIYLDSVVGNQEQRSKVVQSFIQDLKNGKKAEFADLKVVVSPKGQVLAVMPWTIAYPSYYQQCEQRQYYCFNRILGKEVQAAFASYQPDLSQPGEIGALRAMLYATIDLLPWSKQLDSYYDQPLRYQLKVSADGQILGYKALDQFTLEKMGKAFARSEIETTQDPKLPKRPTTTFQIEFQGGESFKLTHELDKPIHELDR
ncbi:MAG: hypothetical protein EA001_00295 [Oscillatoriales cyanobacterium]|nr:MAG: hypothetical protein EA001_00295 [Oscillatoriales cyanobacterium]